MKKPRHKYLIIFHDGDAKVVWHPTNMKLSIADIALNLDTMLIQKNRCGGRTNKEFKEIYEKFKDIIRNSCTSKWLENILPLNKKDITTTNIKEFKR